MICSQHLLNIFIHYQKKKSEFPSAVIFLQPESYHPLMCRYAGKNIPLLFFHLKMFSFAFILKKSSIPYVMLTWVFIGPIISDEKSVIYKQHILWGNWVTGTKFRETTSSQKVSKEETVICKSEEGRETTKIVEQRPPKTSFIVKQFNWWQLHIQKTIIQSLLKLSERQIKKIYSIGSVAFGWLFPFTPLC